MITVAFATENDDFDTEVYRALLQKMLGEEVIRWKTNIRFGGWKSVLHLAELYLDRAAAHGVRHALLAIDNDGGAKRRPEHEISHNISEHAADADDGCAYCLLASAVPPLWVEQGGRYCLVVPVQVLETWLLVLRGGAFDGPPEGFYYRPFLKASFFGKPLPPVERRTLMALEQVEKPGALSMLRERPSFRLFEDQLNAWRTE